MMNDVTRKESLLKQAADSLREYLKWSYGTSITMFNFSDSEGGTLVIVSVDFRGKNVTITKEVTDENMKLKHFADLLSVALARKFEAAIGGMGSRT